VIRKSEWQRPILIALVSASMTMGASAQTVTGSGTAGTVPVFTGSGATSTIGTPTSPITVTSSGNVGIGTGTPAATLDVYGAIDVSGGTAYWQDTVNGNFAVGYSLLPSTVTPISGTGQGKSDFAVGQGSLNSVTTGSENTAVGPGVLHAATTGTFNTGLGWMVLHANTTGQWNNGLGGGALEYVTTGNYNNGFGYESLYSLVSGTGNAAYGSSAGLAINSGSYNTLFGYDVGSVNLIYGSHNILIGTDGSTDLQTKDATTTYTSNSLNIGNTIYAKNMYNLTNTSGVGYVGIGTSNPSALFSVGSGSPFQVNATGAISTSGGLAVTAGAVSLPSASIANSALQGSGALTVTAGAGLSGGGAVALGSSTALSLPTVGAAGVYGSNTEVPTITIDAYGRVTAAANTLISGLSPAWSSLASPTANLVLTTGSYTTTLTAGSSTGTNNIFNFADTASNTGTGNLVNIATAANSKLNPLTVYAAAGSNPSLQVLASGNVGIGTTTPGAIPPSGYVTGTPIFEVKGDVVLTHGSGGSITFQDGSIQSTAYTGNCGGDYAESVDVTGDRTNYEPGDVLVIDPEHEGKFLKSAESYSTSVTGIYSTKPGTIGRRQLTPKSPDEVPMAMIGIVPTKVSAENGPIHPGDLLVTSSTFGYAMKGTERNLMLGAVIGKALGSLDEGTGVIEVVVTLQ
jgi:hypothetical protein